MFSLRFAKEIKRRRSCFNHGMADACVYRECLLIELKKQSLHALCEQSVPLVYKGTPLKGVLKLDLLVDNRVVVEVKAVEQYHPVHLAQLVTYLKLTGHPAGLLMNFNVTSLRSGLRRADHPDRYKPQFSTGADDEPSGS